MSSRRSFTVESPHFGQFREPSTPQSLSKQPFQQQIIDAGKRVAQQMMSMAAEGVFLGEDSKFTFPGPQNDSTAKYDLKFDSFQQVTPVKKHNNIQIVNTFCRQPKEQSQDEDTKRGDPMNQQSTSEPKSTDFCASIEDEEDLEQLIASVSRKAAKRLNITNSHVFSSESTSHHASTESNSNHSERLVLAPKALNREVNDYLSSSQVITRLVPFNYTIKEGLNIFKDSTLEQDHQAEEFAMTDKSSPRATEVRFSPSSLQKHLKAESDLLKTTGEQKIKDRDSKLIDYEENLSRGFKRKGLYSKALKENQVPSLSLKLSSKPIELSVRDKSRNSSKKKKSHDPVGDRIRPRVHVEVGFSKELNVSRLPLAGEITPRNSSARKTKTTSNIPLCLNISSTARSPKHPQTLTAGLSSAKSASKLYTMKDQLASKMALIRSPTGDKSFNASTFMKTLQHQTLKSSNKSQTPLSKKELKKFMEKRKFTSTVMAEGNGSLLSRSAVKLKSKRKQNSELTERTTTGRQKTPDGNGGKHSELGFSEIGDTLTGSQLVRESKESTGSYLGELLHERGTARSTLRASGEQKMGELDKARIRQMGDRHRELSKCMTSRAKPSLEIQLENSFVRSKVEHLRKCENTPERIPTRQTEVHSEMERSRNFEQDGPREFKGRFDSTLHKSGELLRRGGNLRIDIGSLSSKVLANLPFDA